MYDTPAPAPKPIAVGDAVRILGGSTGKVLAQASDGRWAVEYDAGDTTEVHSYDASCLEMEVKYDNRAPDGDLILKPTGRDTPAGAYYAREDQVYAKLVGPITAGTKVLRPNGLPGVAIAQTSDGMWAVEYKDPRHNVRVGLWGEAALEVVS